MFFLGICRKENRSGDGCGGLYRICKDLIRRHHSLYIIGRLNTSSMKRQPYH
ncbi:hypothetical protein HMPREF9120_02048 [Neisseria sp. oral taxon 020 str. F0370]|nr:hypothetical protein HMPREF9120_02048 [Neisseria sp. oral taxon 020 str. F0370]